MIQKDKRLTEDVAKIFAAEILLALEDLHKRDIIFRDLKPDNVVLDKDGHAMLTDFGLSKEGVNEALASSSFCGSVAYLAPEVLKRSGHGKSVDWYLLGVLIYEMLVGMPPYFSTNREQLFKNIENSSLKLPVFLTPEAKNLIVALMIRNPTKRLGSGKGDAEELKAHSWFKGIDWAAVFNKKLKPPKPVVKVFSSEPVPKNIFSSAGKDKNHIKDWSFVSKPTV